MVNKYKKTAQSDCACEEHMWPFIKRTFFFSALSDSPVQFLKIVYFMSHHSQGAPEFPTPWDSEVWPV